MIDKLKWFYKSDNGRISAVAILVLAVLLYFKVSHKTFTGQPAPEKSKAVPGQIVKTQTEVNEFESNAPRIVTKPTRPVQQQQDYTVSMLPIDGYTAKTPSVSDQFAPYGRLIKCKLVNTLESNNSDTPIIGLIMEDVWFNGKKLMSAGVTEVHGSITTSRVRDRINSNKNWVVVWSTHTGEADNGNELPLSGIALAYAPDAQAMGQRWQLIDGSAGLKGYTIDTTDWQKLLMIAAAFIQGAGQGLTESTVYNYGGGSDTYYDGSLKSGLAQGFSKSAELLAQSMLDEIKKNGVYVRVPAGTMFYLYVTQTLDTAPARIGASNLNKSNNTNSNTN